MSWLLKGLVSGFQWSRVRALGGNCIRVHLPNQVSSKGNNDCYRQNCKQGQNKYMQHDDSSYILSATVLGVAPTASNAAAAFFTSTHEYGIKDASWAEGAACSLEFGSVRKGCASGPQRDANKAG